MKDLINNCMHYRRTDRELNILNQTTFEVIKDCLKCRNCCECWLFNGCKNKQKVKKAHSEAEEHYRRVMARKVKDTWTYDDV